MIKNSSMAIKSFIIGLLLLTSSSNFAGIEDTYSNAKNTLSKTIKNAALSLNPQRPIAQRIKDGAIAAGIFYCLDRSTCIAHETGHALAAILMGGKIIDFQVSLKPCGSGEVFYLCPKNNYPKLFFLAGPCAGLLACYGGLKVLQILQEYKAGNTLKQSIKLGYKKPFYDIFNSHRDAMIIGYLIQHQLTQLVPAYSAMSDGRIMPTDGMQVCNNLPANIIKKLYITTTLASTTILSLSQFLYCTLVAKEYWFPSKTENE